MASSPFKLSAVLYGHSMDVRAVAVTHDNYIVSASRDKSAKVWKPNGVDNGFSCVNTLKGHSHFVSSICVLPPSPQHPNGLICTGGNDKIICIFVADNPNPVNILSGHTDTVCNVSPGITGDTLLSSSWDKTAKLWNVTSGGVLANFIGHEAAVWAVIQLPNGNIVTGAADKNIIIWTKDGNKVRTLTGHKDCVRGLVVLNDEVFMSVANDASIKQWTTQGDLINTFYGHNNYIYSICLDKGGSQNFVTSGEDSCVRYWQGNENTQTISLPAESVWSVATLSNGDIVTGSSDGKVRVFTQIPDRVAEQNVLELFEQEVNAVVAASNQEIGGVKVSDLPGKEVLYEPGKSDGQTKLIRDGTLVQCFSWSAAEGKWNKIGDVMGAAGGTQETSGKVLYEGKEYDFVFSVDVEDGKPPLKLPYNIGEDPWVVAQAFIHKNELPQAFLEQVANFIVTNSAGKQPASTAAPAANSNYVDPFTGAARYVPGSSSGYNVGAGNNADPFTGGSSYTTSNPAPPRSNVNNAAGNADPFTGGSSYTTVHADYRKPMYIPQKTYLRFDAGNVSAIHNKLKEFNSKVGDGGHTVEEEQLENVIKLADDKCTVKNVDSVKILVKMLNWPDDIIFPVLDLVRMAIRNQDLNYIICSGENSNLLANCLRKYINENCRNSSNQLCSLRILINLFCHPSGEQLAIKLKTDLLPQITAIGGIPNVVKNIQVALSTVILNYCIASGGSGQDLVATALVKLVPVTTELEALFRLFVTIGTLVSEAGVLHKPQVIGQLMADVDFKLKLSNYAVMSDNISSDPILLKLVKCSKQVYDLLKE